MAVSRYEKYMARRPNPTDPSIQWGRPDLGVIVPHFILDTRGDPIREADTMIEFVWVVEDSAFGVTEDKPPHKHDCDELFLFIGNDPHDTDDLGADVELWMGEGEETDKVEITTSSCVFIPGGLLHLPLFFQKVRRPLLWQVIALNLGDTLTSVEKWPLRGV